MLPRLLVIDDLFGRSLPGGRNPDRENLCAHFLWKDISGDAAARASKVQVKFPTAEVVFCRGQVPAEAGVGALVQNDLAGALRAVREGWHGAMSAGRPPWAMLLLDLCFYTGRVTDESDRLTPGMPEGSPEDNNPISYFGLRILEAIHRSFPELPVLILSSKPREEVSLQFSECGALGFIARDDLRGPELLNRALWQHGLLPDSAGEIVGYALPLLLALREARRAAQHQENLLIRGERGCGKELLAAYIHRARSDEIGVGRPFVTVNSAVLHTHLFSSELFGIEAKTASGVEGKVGLIETAHGGDLFLDEIADMPPEVQAAMLRVLQERQIMRVGARRPKSVDVRFLSATNANLEQDPRAFRPDLLDRLRFGGTLWLPPLRDRPTDLPILAETFLREAEARQRSGVHRTITKEALAFIQDQVWHGNVRELRACIFDAVSRHPDVEYVVPNHLRVAGAGRSTPPLGTRELLRPDVHPAESASGTAGTAAGLLDMYAGVHFDPYDLAQWTGKLADLQRAQTWMLARYLQAALVATKRRTPQQPGGIIQILPALKLMTGDARLTASKAADMVKRILGPLQAELEGDLHAAFQSALRLRPRSTRLASSEREPE